VYYGVGHSEVLHGKTTPAMHFQEIAYLAGYQDDEKSDHLPGWWNVPKIPPFLFLTADNATDMGTSSNLSPFLFQPLFLLRDFEREKERTKEKYRERKRETERGRDRKRKR